MHDITHIGFAVMRRVAYGLNVNLRECQSFQGINYLSELRCVSSPERSLESREVAIFLAISFMYMFCANRNAGHRVNNPGLYEGFQRTGDV